MVGRELLPADDDMNIPLPTTPNEGSPSGETPIAPINIPPLPDETPTGIHEGRTPPKSPCTVVVVVVVVAAAAALCSREDGSTEPKSAAPSGWVWCRGRELAGRVDAATVAAFAACCCCCCCCCGGIGCCCSCFCKCCCFCCKEFGSVG